MGRLKVAVAGACGRMGQEVVRTVLDQSDMELVGAMDVQRAADVGQFCGLQPCGVAVTADVAELLATGPNVLVDFTRFDTAPQHLRAVLHAGVSCVVGTTGLSNDVLAGLGDVAAAQRVCCFVAPNFSVGAVLMMRFAREAARYFDWAEVIELHHEKKLDAPSGTALRTAELMVAGHGRPFEVPPSETLKLEGVRGGLKDGVRIHSVRLPGYLAHQEVLLGGTGEVLTLRHDSTSRTSFMPGVMLAVRKVSARQGLLVGLEHLMEDIG